MSNNLNDLIKLAQKADIQISFQTGDLGCAFVGEWNAGKTSIINALIGTKLPVKPISTTKTVIRLRKTNQPETLVTYSEGKSENKKGDGANLLAEEASMMDVCKIEYGNPEMDLPENVIFIDTPGFNDEDSAANIKAESTSADIIVFVLQGQNSILNVIQKDFIENAIMAKGNDLEDILFLITHSDLIDQSERKGIIQRFLEQIGYNVLNKEQFYFVSTKQGEGVIEFKEKLFNFLEKRKSQLLPDRNKNIQNRLKRELESVVVQKKELLRYLEDEKDEKKQELKKELSKALEKERLEREKIRVRNRERLVNFENILTNAFDNILINLENLIDNLSEEELKAKGRIEQEISQQVSTAIEPLIKQKTEELQSLLEKDLSDAEVVSCDLVNNLNLQLPKYISRGPKISAEGIMPLLAIGTLMTTGLFSIPFFVIGIAALNADKLGLTGTKGYLNTALQKAKSLGLAAHKKTIKMSIANSFTDYREKLRFQINSVFEKTVEHQLQQIGYAQSIKNDLEKVLSDSGIEKTRILIKEVEATLSK